MAATVVDKIIVERTGNPAEKLLAYVWGTETIDPVIIRSIVLEGRVKLNGGGNVHKVITNGGVRFHTNDAGKASLGF